MISLTSLTASSSFDAIAAAQFEAECQARQQAQTTRPPRRRGGGRLLGLVFVVAAALVAAHAQAVPVSRTYTVSAPTSGPLSSFSLAFDITFDDAADVSSDTTAGLSLVSAPPGWSGTLAFQYYSGADMLLVGGTYGGVTGFGSVVDDVYFAMFDAAAVAGQIVYGLAYSDQGAAGASIGPVAVSFTVDDPATTVPEPATLALVGAAGLGLAAAPRRRARGAA